MIVFRKTRTMECTQIEHKIICSKCITSIISKTTTVSNTELALIKYGDVVEFARADNINMLISNASSMNWNVSDPNNAVCDKCAENIEGSERFSRERVAYRGYRYAIEKEA